MWGVVLAIILQRAADLKNLKAIASGTRLFGYMVSPPNEVDGDNRCPLG